MLLAARQNNKQQPKQKEQRQPLTTVATKTDLSFVHIATNLLQQTVSGNMRAAALYYRQKGVYLQKLNEHVDMHDYRQAEHHLQSNYSQRHHNHNHHKQYHYQQQQQQQGHIQHHFVESVANNHKPTCRNHRWHNKQQ